MLILHCTNHVAAFTKTGWLQARQEMKRDNDRSGPLCVCPVCALISSPCQIGLNANRADKRKKPIGFCCDSGGFADDDAHSDSPRNPPSFSPQLAIARRQLEWLADDTFLSWWNTQGQGDCTAGGRGGEWVKSSRRKHSLFFSFVFFSGLQEVQRWNKCAWKTVSVSVALFVTRMDHGSPVRAVDTDGHTLTHTHTLWIRTIWDSSWAVCRSLSDLPNLISLLLPKPVRVSVTLCGFLWIKHLTTALPFLSKHNFSCYLSYFFVTKHVQAV